MPIIWRRIKESGTSQKYKGRGAWILDFICQFRGGGGGKERARQDKEKCTDGRSINHVLAFRFIAVEDLEVLSPQRQYLETRKSNREAGVPNVVTPSNDAHASISASRNEGVYDMKERVMLGDIGGLRDRMLGSTYNLFLAAVGMEADAGLDYLVVVVGKRRDKTMVCV